MIEARRDWYNTTLMDLDLMNAIGILYNAHLNGRTEIEMKHVYAFKRPEVVMPVEESVDNEQSVNVFKQWVTATGGSTV